MSTLVYLESVDGKSVVLSSNEYRVLYWAARNRIAHVHTNSGRHACDSFMLKHSGELVTATTKALVRKGYLLRDGNEVSVTGKGLDVMNKYWSKKRKREAS